MPKAGHSILGPGDTWEIFKVPFFIATISNLMVNLYLIILLKRNKLLRVISYIFVFALGISELLQSIEQLALLVVFEVSPDERDRIKQIEDCSTYLSMGAWQFSLLMIALIAIDRYIHMRFLTKYQDIMTVKRAIIFIALNFLLSLLSVFLLYILSDSSSTSQALVIQICYNCLIGLFLLSLCIVYWKSYRSIKRRTNEMSLERPATSLRRDPSQVLSKAVIYILAPFFVCYLPYITITIISTKEVSQPESITSVLSSISQLLLTCVSVMNSIILISVNRQLRQYTKALFKRLSTCCRYSEKQLQSTIHSANVT